MEKIIKSFATFAKSIKENVEEEMLSTWTLTVYDEDDNIRHQEDIDSDDELKAETTARKMVDNMDDYRDGWDWTLMPKEFFA